MTNVVNPQSTMVTILEAEENIRTGAVSPEKMPQKLIALSQNYADLGHWGKAMHALKQALKAKGGPDPEILNKLGICAVQMGDYDRAEKFYREAMRSDSWSGTMFNLALFQCRRGHWIALIVASQTQQGDREARISQETKRTIAATYAMHNVS